MELVLGVRWKNSLGFFLDSVDKDSLVRYINSRHKYKEFTMPNAPGKVVIAIVLTEDEVQKLDYLASKVRHTRAGYAAFLLAREIEREYTEVSEKNGAF